MNHAPSSWQLQEVMSLAMATLDQLRSEDGLVIETGEDVLAALTEEGVDVATILRRLVRAALDAKAMAAAAKARVADLRARQERFERQEDVYRTAVAAVMNVLSLTKFADAEFTLSLREGAAKLVITDANELPDYLMVETVVRTPDKAATKAALEAGEVVPGALLSNPMPVLTVRSR